MRAEPPRFRRIGLEPDQRLARQGKITPLANVALALEYEATCRLAEHRLAAGLDLHEVGVFVDAVLAMAEPVETHFMWRPQLRDPGQAAAIVTFNRRDFGFAPARFGIELLTLAEVIRRIGT
jgi:hypothetical protein